MTSAIPTFISELLKRTKVAILSAFIAVTLTACGHPFGEPWECDKFVDMCIIR